MFTVVAVHGIITLVYRDYNRGQRVKTLNFTDSIALSALLGMVGTNIDMLKRQFIEIPQETKAGTICSTYI